MQCARNIILLQVVFELLPILVFTCSEYISKTIQGNQMKFEILIAGNDAIKNPLGICCQNDVVLTSMRHDHVALTLI